MSTAKKTAAKKAAKKQATEAPVEKPRGKGKKVLPTNKLKPVDADVLGFLHSSGKRETLGDIAAAVGKDAGAAKKSLKTLVEELYIEEVPAKANTPLKYHFVGMRVSRLTEILSTLRENKDMTPGEVGQAIWADPKKPAANDGTRFMAAAAAQLKNANGLGAIALIEVKDEPNRYAPI